MFLVRRLDRAATLLIVSALVTGEVLRVSLSSKGSLNFRRLRQGKPCFKKNSPNNFRSSSMFLTYLTAPELPFREFNGKFVRDFDLRLRKLWLYYVLVLLREGGKCTDFESARAKVFYCLLNLLFRCLHISVIMRLLQMVIDKLSGKPDDLLWVLYERVSDVPSTGRLMLQKPD